MLESRRRNYLGTNEAVTINECLSRGVERHREGDLHGAEQLYREILAVAPAHAIALQMLGLVMIQTNRLQGGVELIDKALAINPNDADALYNRGNALRALKRLDEALASYDKALAIRPDSVEALNNRGNVLQELKRFDEALASYDKALAVKPNRADTLSNRGGAFKELNRLDEALASYDRALSISPNDAEALYNRGLALQELQRFDAAMASYDKALAIKPLHADARYNRALLALQRGDFVAGWTDYESRWNRKGAPNRKLKASLPTWRGEDASRKKIIIYDEQGLGDVIQFSRYLKILAKSGARVTFLARPSLLRLIRSSNDSICVTAVEPTEAFDCQSALLSLPLAFRTTFGNIPAETPYLGAEPERVQKWRVRLGDHGFKIGVAWQGSKAGKIDIGRSFALTEFLGLSQLPNVRLISLQKNEGVEQLEQLPDGMRVETLGDDFDAGDDAFLDAAAVMENLDLVISSDTAIAHLAGALARPVWLALKQVPDWRWMLDRADSPWYPTMRLFRQQTMGDWRGVFTDIECALRQLIGPPLQQSGP